MQIIKTRIFSGIALLALLVSPSLAMAHSMTVVERATSDAVTDTGAKDDSAGDILTFSNDLFDRHNKTKVGTDNGYCFRTAAGKAWECAWSNALKDGQIMVQGSFLDGKDSVLAITGGTGKYRGAKGEMTLHARDEKGSEYDFVFHLR